MTFLKFCSTIDINDSGNRIVIGAENFGNSREDIMRMLREELLSFMKPKKATGGRVQAASGGLVGILKL